MTEAAGHFIEDVRIESKQHGIVDIHKLAGALAFDVIARAGLGYEFDTFTSTCCRPLRSTLCWLREDSRPPT